MGQDADLEPPVVARGGGPHPDRPLVQVGCAVIRALLAAILVASNIFHPGEGSWRFAALGYRGHSRMTTCTVPGEILESLANKDRLCTPTEPVRSDVQGYLAHEKTPPPPSTAVGP